MYGYDYYDYGYGADAVASDAMFNTIFFIVYFAIYGVILATIAGCYIMQAIAYMRIARKRGIRNGWLAFIPVAESYLVGSIASGYDKEKGIERNWGKILLTAYAIGYGIFVVVYMVFIVAVFAIAAMSAGLGGEMTKGMAIMLMLFYVLIIISMLGVAVYSALRIVCDFKNYEGMAPQKAVKYTVLTAVVPFAGPILLLKCAKTIPDVNATEETPLIEE